MKETLLPGPHFSNVGYRYPPGKSLYPIDKYLGKPILLCYPLDGDFWTG